LTQRLGKSAYADLARFLVLVARANPAAETQKPR
jgi:hypothetical protein